VVPECLVKVVKNFDGEDLMWIGERSIGEVPVTPKWEINPIQTKQAPGFAGIGSDLGWVELGGKCLKGREYTGSGARWMLDRIAKFFVRCHREVRCLPGDASKCHRFWRVNDASDEWRETISYVASVVREPVLSKQTYYI